VVACVEARLQLSDPIPASGEGQLRISFQALLKLAFIKLLIVERGKAWSQTRMARR
jgi:hypothetical protein